MPKSLSNAPGYWLAIIGIAIFLKSAAAHLCPRGDASIIGPSSSQSVTVAFPAAPSVFTDSPERHHTSDLWGRGRAYLLTFSSGGIERASDGLALTMRWSERLAALVPDLS